MAQATPRPPFHSSRLLRVLAELTLLEGAAPGAAFAERLGQWVGYTDAIRLCAVHTGVPAAAAAATATAKTTAPSATAASVGNGSVAHAAPAEGPGHGQTFAGVRAELEAAIRKAGAALAPTTDYEPYRRHYVAQQREMELRVGPLRAQLRAELALGAPNQRQLAALDAAFDDTLAEREARLLASVPLLLNKRFAHLRRVHEAPATPAWLATFSHEVQTVLLAELDLRLQPALGLLEALQALQVPQSLDHEKTQQHL